MARFNKGSRNWVSNGPRIQEAIASSNAFLSNSDKVHLTRMAKDQNISLSVLLARAINNEMDSSNPFERKLTLDDPKTDLSEQDDDSMLLFSFIKKYPSFGLEHLLILKADVGIKTDQKLIRAYEHLKHVGITKEYYNGDNRICICVLEPDERQISNAVKPKTKAKAIEEGGVL